MAVLSRCLARCAQRQHHLRRERSGGGRSDHRADYHLGGLTRLFTQIVPKRRFRLCVLCPDSYVRPSLSAARDTPRTRVRDDHILHP